MRADKFPPAQTPTPAPGRFPPADGEPGSASPPPAAGCGHLRSSSAIRNPQSAVILIAVLWIVAVVGFIGVTYAFRTHTDLKAAAYARSRMQADLLAQSAIEKARAVLALDDPSADYLGETWADAPNFFADVPLDGVPEGIFSVIGRVDETDRLIRYGLVDECGKINLNTATRDMLVRLPGMTADAVDAILDWRDSDDVVRSRGAENAYYLGLRRPYTCKNAPFESIEEVMLVRGMTSAILWGEDANRNGLLEPNEDDADTLSPADDQDGVLNMGIYRYITIWSKAANVDADGKQRIFLNLPQQQLIQALRPYVTSPTVLTAIGARRRQAEFRNLGELLDVQGMTEEIFGQLVDHVSLSREPVVEGLVNPNTAPEPVLRALGISEQDAAALVAFRTQSPDSTNTLAWVLRVLGKDKFKPVSGLLTPRSQQFSFEAVGRFTSRPVFKRIWVVLDRQQSPSQIVFWEDLTGLGLAYPPPDLTVTQARSTP